MLNDLILIFAYHFPPDNVIGAARPFRFYKYLRRLGHRCHVITAANVSGFPELDAETVPDPFVVSPGSGLGWHIERGVRKLLLPGVVGLRWAFQACRAGERAIGRKRSTRVTIFSTFPPLGAHLAAYALSRRLGIPWIADYRDPLSGEPVDNDSDEVRKALVRTIERTFVGSAAIVIANTDSALDKLIARYPTCGERIHVIWNGFDPEERLSPLPKQDSGIQLVSHIGHLYGGRNIAPILESLGRLIASGRLVSGRIRVELVGTMVESSLPDRTFLEAAEREGWLKLIPEGVPQAEAQEMARRSDGLLLVQPQSAIQVPGKLFEYLQIGRPILAYVPRSSPVERILQRSGVPFECVYSEYRPHEIDVSIERFFALSGVHVPPNSWFEQEFSANSQSRKLSDLIQSLHA